MKKRLFSVAAVAMTLAMALAGCSSSTGETTEEGAEQTEQTEDPVELTQIQVGVNGQDILFVYGAGTVLIIFSVTAAGIPVLRLKPKEILTKMN